MIVGIDNGLKGGLCAISEPDGNILAKCSMPTMHRSKKTEIDASKIKAWLGSLNSSFILAVEEPLGFAKSSQAVRSMALSFGKLMGMAECCGYTVSRVSVHKWQKEMLGPVAKGKSKQAALHMAQTMAPEENWLRNKRCRTPDDGMIDAFLIARYCLTKRAKSL